MSEFYKCCGQAYGDAWTLLHDNYLYHSGRDGNHVLFKGDTDIG